MCHSWFTPWRPKSAGSLGLIGDGRAWFGFDSPRWRVIANSVRCGDARKTPSSRWHARFDIATHSVVTKLAHGGLALGDEFEGELGTHVGLAVEQEFLLSEFQLPGLTGNGVELEDGGGGFAVEGQLYGENFKASGHIVHDHCARKTRLGPILGGHFGPVNVHARR